MNLMSQIEAILFVASKPLSQKKIAASLLVDERKVEEALEILKMKYNQEDSGIHILESGKEYQMSSNPMAAEILKSFVKEEIAGELTKAQLETLTIVAYRGPITRAEIEQIRGVNCALILRHLLIRGLLEEENDDQKLAPAYRLSMEALAHLGIQSVDELPEYDILHAHEYIEHALQQEQME